MSKAPHYYSGLCPAGKEQVVPQDKLTWFRQDEGPYINCPIHGVKVSLFTITEEEHKKYWEQMKD